MANYSAVLFDLDGTIFDSAPGITATLAYTYRQLGLVPPEHDQLMRWVGPPIMDSFRDLAGFDELTSARALAVYREKYLAEGAFDSALFPGMRDVLAATHAAPVLVSLATSKPELPATTMLEHEGLASYFDVITGASADEVRSAKADVVAEALVRLRALGADLSNPIMVGDRHHDIEGAAVHGVPTIAVSWGYGTPVEHEQAVAVAHTADDLRDLLGV